MFLQYEDETDPILRWSWRFLTDYQVVENVVGWPSYRWMPDGHISTLRNTEAADWITFYPNSASYRARGPSPLPELSESLEPSNGVIGGVLDYDVYHNGGEWLDSIFLTDRQRGLTGFVHAEDHYWVEGEGLTGQGKAFKSISLGGLHVTCITIVPSTAASSLQLRPGGDLGEEAPDTDRRHQACPPSVCWYWRL